jgi:hypothetical protein
MKTTNYHNTFISVADDCPAKTGEIPPEGKTSKSAARVQYEMVSGNPYQHTSDDVIFEVYARKNNIPEKERPAERKKFFSIGRPCMRASALTKRYGWGVHSDENGNIAIYGVGTEQYRNLRADTGLKQVKAMKTSRK